MGCVLWVLCLRLWANTEAATEARKRMSLGHKHGAWDRWLLGHPAVCGLVVTAGKSRANSLRAKKPCNRGYLLRAPSRAYILGAYLASGGPYCVRGQERPKIVPEWKGAYITS